MTGINAEADVSLNSLIELCLCELANSAQSLIRLIKLCLIECLCTLDILLTVFHV